MKRFVIGVVIVVAALNVVEMWGIRGRYVGTVNAIEDPNWTPVSFKSGSPDIHKSVRIGEGAAFAITIANSAGEEIRFRSYSTSCQCTQLKVLQEHLASGQETQIVGRVRSKPDGGHVKVFLSLEAVGLVSGQRKKIPCSIEVDYTSSIEVTPKMSYFSNLQSDPCPSAEIHIRNTTTNYMEASLAMRSLKDVTVTPQVLRFAPDEAKTVLIESNLRSEQSGFLSVSLDQGRESHEIPISFAIKGRVVSTPRVLVLGRVRVQNGIVVASNPAKLQLRGELLKTSSVRVSDAPQFFTTPKQSVVNDDLIIDFSLSEPMAPSDLLHPIRLEIVSNTGEVIQIIDIPVIGIADREAEKSTSRGQ